MSDTDSSIRAVIVALLSDPSLLTANYEALSDLAAVDETVDEEEVSLGLSRSPQPQVSAGISFGAPRFGAKDEDAQTGPRISSEKTTKYVSMLLGCGILPAEAEAQSIKDDAIEWLRKHYKAEPDDDAVVRTLEEHTTKKPPTVQHVEGVTKERSDPVSDDEGTEHGALASIFRRADELAFANKGGNLPKGTHKKEQMTVRLDCEVVSWLKSKGPRHNARVNGMLRALMEHDENEPK